MAPAKADLVAFLQITVSTERLGRLAHPDAASQRSFQRPGRRDVVGMNVRFQRPDKVQMQFAQQRGVASRLLEHWIDEHGLTRIRQQISVGGRGRIEQLTEDQQSSSPRMDWLLPPAGALLYRKP